MKRTKIIRKIKWANVAKLIGGTIFGYLFLKDWFTVLFKGACFTWFGLFTNFIFLGISYLLFNDIFEFDK